MEKQKQSVQTTQQVAQKYVVEVTFTVEGCSCNMTISSPSEINSPQAFDAIYRFLENTLGTSKPLSIKHFTVRPESIHL
jgi:hypothetical protein